MSIVDGTKIRYNPNGPICASDWSFCGGMALEAAERFSAGLESYTQARDAMKPAIFDAQMQTLDERTVSKFLAWMASPDEGHWHDATPSIGHRMKEDWDNLIRPRLDRREPVVLGLIFDKHATLLKYLDASIVLEVFRQHQVLGIGYTAVTASTFTIKAYDPNYPNEVLELTFSSGQPSTSLRLASGKPLYASQRIPRGIMFVRGVPAAGPPPTGAGVFLSTGTSLAYAQSWTGAGYGSAPKGWYVGDFNGDGKADVMRYMPGTCGGEVFLSSGANFSGGGGCWTTAGYGSAPEGWYVGDFNGDGKADLMRYLLGQCGANIWLSTGTGFRDAGCWTAAGYGSARMGWYVGDFNGDGKADLMRYMPGQCGANVWLSTGTSFRDAGCWTMAGYGSAPNGWYVGDLNGDGKTDLMRYMPGQCGGEVFLSSGTNFAGGGGCWTMAGYGSAPEGWYVGDFNGDRKTDLMRYMPGKCGAEVFLSSGTNFSGGGGCWTMAGYGSAPEGWYLADVDGDRKTDIFRVIR